MDGILETRGGGAGAGIVTNHPSWSATSRFDVVDFPKERRAGPQQRGRGQKKNRLAPAWAAGRRRVYSSSCDQGGIFSGTLAWWGTPEVTRRRGFRAAERVPAFTCERGLLSVARSRVGGVRGACLPSAGGEHKHQTPLFAVCSLHANIREASLVPGPDCRALSRRGQERGLKGTVPSTQGGAQGARL